MINNNGLITFSIHATIHILKPNPDFTIYSDVSVTGWGIIDRAEQLPRSIKLQEKKPQKD